MRGFTVHSSFYFPSIKLIVFESLNPMCITFVMCLLAQTGNCVIVGILLCKSNLQFKKLGEKVLQ